MIEKLLLSKLVKNEKDLFLCSKRLLQAKHFEYSDCGNLYDLINQYFTQYKSLPSYDNLKICIDRCSFKNISLQALGAEIYSIQSHDPTEFLIDSIFEVYKERLLKDSIVSTLDNLKSKNIDAVVSEIERSIGYIRSTGTKDTSCEDAKADTELRKLRARTPESKGIFSGFSSLDQATGGFRAGELWVVLGYLKNGKTTFMLNMAHNAWAANKNVLYVSVEQSRESILRRRDAIMSQVSAKRLKKGDLTQEELLRYDMALEAQLKGSSFYVYDAPGCTTSMVQSKVRELKALGSLDLVCVDYIGIIEPSGGSSNQYEKLGNVALELRNIARLEQVPVITAHQLKSEGLKAKRLGGQHVAGSVDIPRHADGSIAIKIEDEEEKNMSPWCRVKGYLFATRDCGGIDFDLEACFDLMTMKEVLVAK